MAEFSFQDALQHSTVNFAFISKLEGGCVTDAYVSEVAGKNAGTIIASGFDLGKHSYEYLQKIGLNPTLRGKLYPYIGRKGEDAIDFLKQHPLQLSEAEVQAIDIGNRGQVMGELLVRYEEDSQFVFSDLPEYWQTVIASISFQYGDLREHCPLFWRMVVRQHWKQALDLLQDFGDSYPTRRYQERSYILAALSD